MVDKAVLWNINNPGSLTTRSDKMPAQLKGEGFWEARIGIINLLPNFAFTKLKVNMASTYCL